MKAGMNLAMGVLGTLAVSTLAFADDWPGAGKFVADDVGDFVNPNDPSTPFFLGEGMLLYTGSTALSSVPMTFNVAEGNGANAVNVQDAGTTLTLAGKVNQTRGAFIKTGPGTLAFTYPGYQRIGYGPVDASILTRDVKWNETTGACTNGGFTNFTLDQGNLVMGAPGQTNDVVGMVFIGNRTQNKVRLAITNGVFKQSGNWFCIARGTGTTSNDAEAEVYVGKDATLSVNQFNLGYNNSMSSPWPRSRLIVDGGQATCASEIYTLENGSGKSEVIITNGGSLVNTGSGWDNAGWRLKQADGGQSFVTIAAGSTAKARYLASRKHTEVSVTGGSTLLFDRTPPTAVDVSDGGRVTFDDATLGTENEGQSLWFGAIRSHHNTVSNAFMVGKGGLTVSVPANADGALAPLIQTAPGATAASAKITKVGAGSAAIALPYQNPIEVKAGDLRLRNRSPRTANVPNQTPTVAAGSRLIAAGEEAFADLTVPSGTPLVLRAQGIEMDKGGNWDCNGWAAARPDGLIGLSDTRASGYGSAFLRRKVDVSSSFSLTFDVAMLALRSGNKAGGFSVCFNAQTTALIGAANDTNIGYRYGTFTNAANKSVAMIVDVNNLVFRFGQNGQFVGSAPSLGVAAAQLATTLETPHRCVLDYDATAGKLTLTMRLRDGIAKTFSQDVNLAAALGASDAYLGFTGSTHSSNPVDYYVSNVAFADAAAPVAMRVGGNVTASAATPLKTDLDAGPGDPAFLKKQLTYSDGAVLDVGQTAAGGNGVTFAPTLADHDAWTLSSSAHWRADGGLGLSYTNYNAQGELSRVSGYAVSKRSVRVDRDWTLDFDFAFGEKGGDVKADCVNIGLVSRTDSGGEVANAGFTVGCRYYYSGTPPGGSWNSTRLYFYKNGASMSAETVPDCAPVRFYDTEAGHFKIVYSASAKTVTVTLTDANGSYTKTVSGIDLKDILGGSETAYFRFHGLVGGSWTENVVSNLKFDTAPAGGYAPAALGFDKWNGSGRIVKRGDGALAVVSTNAQNVAVTVEKGGLYLAKEDANNDLVDTGRGGWLRSDGEYANGERGGAVVGYFATNSKGTTHYRRRLPVGRSWTFSGDMFVVGYQDWGNQGEQAWPGNAMTFFVHNDPKGTTYRGGTMNNGGFGNGVQNGWALNFFMYSDTDKKQRYCWTTGVERYTNETVSASYAPVLMNSRTTTHFDIAYDASAKTVKLTMTQGSNKHENKFSGVDLKSLLGNSEWGWLGFGMGGGGAHGIADWHNVRMTFGDGADTYPTENFLRDVAITAAESTVQVDSRQPDGVFRLAPTVSVADGSTLAVLSVAKPATLTMGTLTLGADATVAGDAATVVAPDALVCGGDLKVDAATLAVPSGEVIDPKDNIRLANGAKLRLAFNGALHARRVFVDGVRVPNGSYGAGDAPWIDPASSGSVAVGVGMAILIR